MPEHIIINADDLGLSRGVNLAIFEAAEKGALTHASLLANGDYFEEAADRIRRGTNLGVGLHANLTQGVALSPPSRIPLLARKDGRFRRSYIGLLGLSLSPLRKTLQRQAEIEIGAQAEKCLKAGVRLTHIDGHQHVQVIPAVAQAIPRLAGRYGIPRIREIHERLSTTRSWCDEGLRLHLVGLLKYLFVKIVASRNARTNTYYFFSIYCSCRMTPEMFRNVRVPPGHQGVEIMLHPGFPSVDAALGLRDRHLLSPFRQREYETALVLKERLASADRARP